MGIAAGLHIVVALPDNIDEERIIEKGREQSIGLYGLTPFYIGENAGPPGLVMGYAALNERAIKAGVQVLGEVIKNVQ